MRIGEFITTLATSVGIDSTDARLADLLSINTEIPDEVMREISGKLITIESAKNNPEISRHYFAQAYNGIDAEINKWVETINDLDFKEQINGIKGTGKKNQLLLNKLKELADNKPAKTDSKELNEKIQSLNAEIEKYKTSYIPKEELDNTLTQIEKERLETIEQTTFLSKEWSDNYASSLRSDLSKIALEKKLAELGAKKVREGGKIKLVQAENPEMDFYIDNKILTFDSLVDQIMVDNKFQAVSKPNTPQQFQHSGNSPIKQAYSNSKVDAAMQRAMADQGMK